MTVAARRSAESKAGWIVQRRLLADLVALPAVWIVVVAGTAVIAGLVAFFGSGSLSTSAWEPATRLAHWYAGGVGVHLTAVYLPLFVTHGITRRQCIAQAPLFAAAFAVGLGVFMTLGYVVERFAYWLLGWPHSLDSVHLYTSATQYGLVWTEYALIGVTWTAAGAAVGAAFYRGAGIGLALLLPILALIALVEMAAGPSTLGAFPWALLPLSGALVEGGSVIGTAGAAAVVTVIAFVVSWLLVRNVPIRTRAG